MRAVAYQTDRVKIVNLRALTRWGLARRARRLERYGFRVEPRNAADAISIATAIAHGGKEWSGVSDEQRYTLAHLGSKPIAAKP